MVAHFVRQLFKGAITIVLASFVIYSLVHSASLAGVPQVIVSGECIGAPLPCPDFDKINAIVKRNQLDKPWPLDYFTWLFDANKPGPGYLNSSVRPIDITIAGLRIKGSGALTGDFGASLLVERDVPVMEELRGAGELLGFTLGLSFILMGVAFYQRRGRLTSYGAAALPTPYTLAEKVLGSATGYRQV